MRKLRNLTGMPVIFHCRKIGRLIQADLSDDLSRLDGIWVDGGLRGTRYIPSEQLGMIGERAVLTDACGIRRRAKIHPMLQRAISTDGSRLGAVVNAEVDEISFLVCRLELTRGFWDDLHRGRLMVSGYSKQGSEIIITDSAQDPFKEEEK